MTVVIISDPIKVFYPGEEYQDADFAVWAEEGTLPEGMVVQVGCSRLTVRDGVLVNGNKTPVPACSDAYTAMRLATLRVVAEYEDMGYNFSQRELSMRLGVKLNAVHNRLKTLERLGWMEHERYQPRSWRLTLMGRQLVDAHK